MPARLRVLVAAVLPPQANGAAIMNALLAEALARRGHEVEAVSPVIAPSPMRPHHAGDPQVPVHRFPLDALRMFPPAADIAGNFRAYAERLLDVMPPVIEGLRPDVLVAGDEASAPAIAELAARHGIASIVIAHGVVTAMMRPDYPLEARDHVLPALHAIDHMVLVAQHLCEPVQRAGFTRVSVIPNGVDTARFRPRDGARLRARLGLGADDVVVFHSSNLRPYKRPSDVIQSAALALLEEPRLRYVIAGDNPVRTEMAEMEEALERLGIAERVHLIGWRPFAAMPLHYAASDITVMTSAHEAAALAYLEAQASGSVLVATDIAAAREVVEHGATGVLYPTADIEALAAETVTLARDSALRRQTAERARAWVEENRNIGACFDAYEKLVAETVGTSRSR